MVVVKVHIKEKLGNWKVWIKKYCNKSVILKEEELHQSICKAINHPIEHQDEFIAIMMSHLESVITGKDANTDIYAIQHQITELNRLRDIIKI